MQIKRFKIVLIYRPCLFFKAASNHLPYVRRKLHFKLNFYNGENILLKKPNGKSLCNVLTNSSPWLNNPGREALPRARPRPKVANNKSNNFYKPPTSFSA